MSAFGLDIAESCVCIFDAKTNKEEALDHLIDAVYQTGAVTDLEALRKATHEREASMSTGIGGGIAIPHVRMDAIRQAVAGVGISPAGIEFAAVDHNPVHIIVFFAMPADANKVYLGLLAQLMVALKDADFRERLVACRTPAEVVAILNESGG